MARMGKKLAEMFCDFVAGPGLPGYRDFVSWRDTSCSDRGTVFWEELALWIRDSEHKHANYALYRLACVLASELQREQEVLRRIGRAFEACVERFGVSECAIQKEDE